MVTVIGHRGIVGHALENTLKPFLKAVELGTDRVELDVHLCASEEAVVIHDDTVDRTTDGTRKGARQCPSPSSGLSLSSNLPWRRR